MWMPHRLLNDPSMCSKIRSKPLGNMVVGVPPPM